MENTENLILRLLPRRRTGVIVRYAITTAIVLLFFSLRYSLDGSLRNYPLLLFIPAVFVSALLFDRGSGFVATFESAALAAYFFMPPRGTLAVDQSEWFALMVFIAICVLMAITTEMLRTALERVAAQEREKDMLLDEVNHRVRNDLQTATALLLAGARQVEPATARALDDAAGRIQVLASVYAKLGRSDSRTKVDAQAFLNGLVDDLGRSSVGLRPITIRRAIEAVPVSLDCASSVGLVLHEAVTNALKYAFVDEREGEIDVRFESDGDDFVLRVRDNGNGGSDGRLESDAAPRGTGLGRKLMRQMAARLQGHLTIAPHADGGVLVELRFPKSCAEGL